MNTTITRSFGGACVAAISVRIEQRSSEVFEPLLFLHKFARITSNSFARSIHAVRCKRGSQVDSLVLNPVHLIKYSFFLLDFAYSKSPRPGTVVYLFVISTWLHLKNNE